jgi:DNA-binding CsgD family transcriptional regulator
MIDRQISELSERELEILRLVATGASNKEIAQKLFISANTVKVHLRNIFSKVGVASRTEAAMYVVRSGLLGPSELPVEFQEGELPDRAAQTVEGGAAGFENEQAILPSEIAAPKETLNPAQLLSRNWYYLLGMALIVGAAVLFLSRLPVDPPAAAQSPSLPSAATWQDLASMPTARQDLAAVAHENLIYAIGGAASQGVGDMVEIFDPRSGEWDSGQPKTTPARGIGTAVLGGLIYVPGGCQDGDLPTAVLEAYDPRSDAWLARASLPFPLCDYALSVFEGRLFLFGGWDGSRYLDSVFIYDPGQDRWSEGTPMQHARAYAGAALSGSKIYILGGYDGQEALSVVEVYSPELEGKGENPWADSLPLPEGRYAMGVVEVTGVIYVLGGKGAVDGAQQTLAFVPADSEWQAIADLYLPESGLSAVTTGPFLYVLGGGVDGAPTDQNLVYQVIYTVSIPVIVK